MADLPCSRKNPKLIHRNMWAGVSAFLRGSRDSVFPWWRRNTSLFALELGSAIAMGFPRTSTQIWSWAPLLGLTSFPCSRPRCSCCPIPLWYWLLKRIEVPSDICLFQSTSFHSSSCTWLRQEPIPDQFSHQKRIWPSPPTIQRQDSGFQPEQLLHQTPCAETQECDTKERRLSYPSPS